MVGDREDPKYTVRALLLARVLVERAYDMPVSNPGVIWIPGPGVPSHNLLLPYR